MFGVCRLRHLVLHGTEHAFSEPWPAWTRLSVPPRTHSNGNTHLVVDEPLDRLRLALLGEEHLDVLIAQAFAGLELVPAAADHSLYVLHALQTEHASEKLSCAASKWRRGSQGGSGLAEARKTWFGDAVRRYRGSRMSGWLPYRSVR